MAVLGSFQAHFYRRRISRAHWCPHLVSSLKRKSNNTIVQRHLHPNQQRSLRIQTYSQKLNAVNNKWKDGSNFKSFLPVCLTTQPRFGQCASLSNETNLPFQAPSLTRIPKIQILGSRPPRRLRENHRYKFNWKALLSLVKIACLVMK